MIAGRSEGRAPSPATATAPLRAASAANFLPSARLPGTATNRSPAATWRLSAEMPRPRIPKFAPGSNSARSIIAVRRAPRHEQHAVGGRQVEARREAEERRDARDDLAGGGRGVDAGGRLAATLRRALRLVEHDQHEVARRVARE